MWCTKDFSQIGVTFVFPVGIHYCFVVEASNLCLATTFMNIHVLMRCALSAIIRVDDVMMQGKSLFFFIATMTENVPHMVIISKPQNQGWSKYNSSTKN